MGLVSEGRIRTNSVPEPQSGSASRTLTTRTRIKSTRTRTPTTRTRRRTKVPPSVFKGRGKFNQSEANTNGSPDQQKGACPSTGRLQMSITPEAGQLVLYSKLCSSQSSDVSVILNHAHMWACQRGAGALENDRCSSLCSPQGSRAAGKIKAVM